VEEEGGSGRRVARGARGVARAALRGGGPEQAAGANGAGQGARASRDRGKRGVDRRARFKQYFYLFIIQRFSNLFDFEMVKDGFMLLKKI
jgi:hypothetical protein